MRLVQHLYMFFVWQSNWSFLVNKPTVRSGVCTESVPTVRDGILGQAPGILRDEASLQWGWRVLSPLVPPGCRRDFGGMRKVSVSPSLPLSGCSPLRISPSPGILSSHCPHLPVSPALVPGPPAPLSTFTLAFPSPHFRTGTRRYPVTGRGDARGGAGARGGGYGARRSCRAAHSVPPMGGSGCPWLWGRTCCWSPVLSSLSAC